MYSAFGSSRHAPVVLAGLAFFILILIAIVGSAQSPWPVIRLLGFLASVLALTAYLALGFSFYWAPWRILWRRFPSLSRVVYPDLNGIWYGMTLSNWPVVSRLREAAASEEAVDPARLAEIELISGEVAIEIRSSLFGMSVRSSVSTANGDPTSVMVRARKNSETGKFELFYIYRQKTSDAQAAEESSHLGTTMLEVAASGTPCLDGFYWTRRNWRDGMSTAGTISAQPVTDRHVPSGVNLLEYAREHAVKTLG